MTDLNALIARPEAATEGSRELDCEIYRAIKQKAGDPPTWLSEVPHYTTSIDAALMLVPLDLTIHLNERLEGVAAAHVQLVGPSGKYMSDSVIHGEAHLRGSEALKDFAPIRKLLPLALCIAALRARAANNEESRK